MLRRQHGVGRAKERVGARGKDHEGALRSGDRKGDLRALGAADPVPLQTLAQLRPVQVAQTIQQPTGVAAEAEEPLLHIAMRDRRMAAFADRHVAVGLLLFLGLLVGQHGQAGGTPDDRRGGAVGQAGLIYLQEDPLRPAVVVGMAGDHLVGPIPHRAHAHHLGIAEAGHGLIGQHGRVDAQLERIVLGMDAKTIEAHGLEDVEALHALEAAIDIGAAVGIDVAHVQALAGRDRGIP